MRRRFRGWIERAWSAPPGRPPRGSRILDLIEGLYSLGLRLRRPRVARAPIAVVSIGSIWAGGAGKTPLASEIAQLAALEGLRPAIVLRGYGGRPGRGAIRVGPETDSGVAGDEACMHARRKVAPVYVARRRIDAVRLAAADGCGIAILDDGMQHRGLARDLEIVTLPAPEPLANGHLLPRGPLREGAAALARADLLVLAHADPPGRGKAPGASIRPHLRAGVPVLSWGADLRLRPCGVLPAPSRGSLVAAVCGIARPDRFRRGLQGLGLRVAWLEAFEDHHRFSRAEVECLRERARGERIGWIVTTEKDGVRLPGIEGARDPAVCVLEMRLDWMQAGAEALLRARVRDAAARAAGGGGVGT